MGEMTIHDMDEAVLVELKQVADRQGRDVEALARDLLTWGVRATKIDRAAVARDIQSAQPFPSRLDSTDLLREDRNR